MAERHDGLHPFIAVHDMLKADLSKFFWDAILALNVNGITGDYVEFGSDGATTIRLVHDVVSVLPVERHLWAFDSFEGLPASGDERDEHPAFVAGMNQGGVERFHSMCADHGMDASDYTAVVGYFEETLRNPDPAGLPTDIALAYVDCNLYSSTVEVLEFLAPRLKHGMIIGFDDYFCFTDKHVSGERLALHQFLARNPEWHFERFKDPAWGAVSYVVERADALSV